MLMYGRNHHNIVIIIQLKIKKKKKLVRVWKTGGGEEERD